MGKADDSLKKAKQVLEEISNDEYERYLAHLREKYIIDQKFIEASGYSRGMEAGIDQAKIEMAKNMKSLKVDIEIIVATTRTN